MGSKHDNAEIAVLNALLRNISLTGRQAYVGLFTADPTDADSGGTEVSGGSYARVGPVTFDAPSGSPSGTANSGAVIFPLATASWGTITHVVIFDAAVAGNRCYGGALTTPKTIDNGDLFEFLTGAITVTEE